MVISKGLKKQIIYLIPPIIWQIAYLVLAEHIEKYHRVYFDMTFYLGISVYFLATGSISLKNLFIEWKKGKKFWIPVVLTFIGIAVAFVVGNFLSVLFPNVDDGMGVLKTKDWPSLAAFALTTIILPPIAEEAFYRKAIISFSNKTWMYISALLGMLLFASEHSVKPLGFLTVFIWSIPFTVSYVKTKNIYISMTAHFICNFLINGLSVVLFAIKLIQG